MSMKTEKHFNDFVSNFFTYFIFILCIMNALPVSAHPTGGVEANTSSADQKSVSSSQADEKSKPDITPSLKPSHYIFVDELSEAAKLFNSNFTDCDVSMFRNSFLQLRKLYFTKADMVDPCEQDSPDSKDSLALKEQGLSGLFRSGLLLFKNLFSFKPDTRYYNWTTANLNSESSLALEKQELPDFFIYGKMLANIREGKLIEPLLEQLLEQLYGCNSRADLEGFMRDLSRNEFYEHNYWDENYVDPVALMLACVICYYEEENAENQIENFYFLRKRSSLPLNALVPLERLAQHRRILDFEISLSKERNDWRCGRITRDVILE